MMQIGTKYILILISTRELKYQSALDHIRQHITMYNMGIAKLFYQLFSGVFAQTGN